MIVCSSHVKVGHRQALQFKNQSPAIRGALCFTNTPQQFNPHHTPSTPPRSTVSPFQLLVIETLKKAAFHGLACRIHRSVGCSSFPLKVFLFKVHRVSAHRTMASMAVNASSCRGVCCCRPVQRAKCCSRLLLSVSKVQCGRCVKQSIF